MNKHYKLLSSNDIFYEKQYGFRSKDSTDHALISVIKKLKNY